MATLNIVKIGGNIIDDKKRLNDFLHSFAQLKAHKILVHGGGKIASEIGKKLGLTPNYINGRRITDAATLELITMVYGGLINKNIAAQLQQKGTNAIGLSGADGAILKSKKRAVEEIDFGFVGDLNTADVNTATINALLQTGLVPVIAPLSYSEGALLNTNADTIANVIAMAMSGIMPVHLIYCFEQAGVLKNIEDPTSVIKTLRAEEFIQYQQDNIINEGMIPKLENAFSAVKAGVAKVIIGQAENLHELIAGTKGTSIL